MTATPGEPEEVIHSLDRNLVNFSTSPSELKEWKPGDELTRKNWMHFLMYSFSFSQGSESWQLAFAQWHDLKYGTSSLDNMYRFVEALNMQVFQLTDDEEAVLRESVQKVTSPFHQEMNLNSGAILEEFQSTMTAIAYSIKNGTSVRERSEGSNGENPTLTFSSIAPDPENPSTSKIVTSVVEWSTLKNLDLGGLKRLLSANGTTYPSRHAFKRAQHTSQNSSQII